MGYMNYEERLEVAKRLYELSNAEQKTALECIFPELKENEDDRIRKELIEHIVKEVGLYPGEDRKEHKWLRWLEKQGEHKKFRDSIQVGDEVTRNRDGVIVNLSQLNRVAKQDEQKLPIEKLPEEMKTIGESLGFTTQEECDEYNQMVSNLIMSDDNKDKTKFKVGDIVRKKDGDGLEWTVLSVEDNKCYKIANEDYDNVVILDDTWEVVEQVTVWSNEDERILKGILGYIGHGQHYGVRNSEMLTWLKSLKERYTWKPSDAH